jgi:hypothetical protein
MMGGIPETANAQKSDTLEYLFKREKISTGKAALMTMLTATPRMVAIIFASQIGGLVAEAARIFVGHAHENSSHTGEHWYGVSQMESCSRNLRRLVVGLDGTVQAGG